MQGRGLSLLQLEQGRKEEGLSGEGSGRILGQEREVASKSASCPRVATETRSSKHQESEASVSPRFSLCHFSHCCPIYRLIW